MNENELPQKISAKDVYLGLWERRDFELKHVWQRSIFLTAFLIACFAGYGGLLLATLNKAGSVVSTPTNFLLFLIAFVGGILSCLWVMMTKGSKAWYEHYEAGITAFVESEQDAFESKVERIAGFNSWNITGYQSPDTCDWLWSTSGGAYSPSKINIAIGHFAGLIWGVLVLFHILNAAPEGSILAQRLVMLKGVVLTPGGMFFILTFGLLFFWLYARVLLKSRHI